MKLRLLSAAALIMGTFGLWRLKLPVFSQGVGDICRQDPGLVICQEQGSNVLDDICQKTPEATVCQENSKTQSPSDNSIYGPTGVFTKAARIVSMIIGIASLIVIIISGFQYVLSSGDSTKVNNAKNMILYAIIGLGVALLAQVIIVFVISKL